MENILFKYSDFFDDDGGMAKVKSDFIKLGDELISEARRVKKEFNQNLSIDNPEMVSVYEKQIDDIIAVNNQYKKSLSDLQKVEKEYQAELKATLQAEVMSEKAKQEKINTTKKEIQAEAELNKAIITENNSKKSQIALEEAQRRQRDASEKSIKKEKDAYGQLSFELNQLFRASANVAVEMFKLEEAGKKTSPTYARLSSEFNILQGRTQKIDSALKQIDSTLGRNQRNVGNYASGFNGLSNSINQMTRELPAFTFSAQTGFLALSNNIPIFVDEINRLKVANKELVAQGKPVQSIFQQITGALFSFNTAISLGITLVTVYGKEISNWVQSLFQGSQALSELNERQKEFLEAKLTGRKDAQGDIIELRKYLAVVKDEKISLEERQIALKQLRDQYPFYFKNLTDAQILAGQSAKAERELTVALEKRKQVEKETDLNVKNKQKLIDLDNRLKKEKEIEDNLKAQMEQLNSIDGINPDIPYQATKKYVSAQKERIQTEAEIKRYTEISIRNDSKIFQNKKDIIGLEYKEEAQRKNKAKDLRTQQINNVDYLASDFEFRKALLNGVIKVNEDIFNSDKYTVQVRIEAQKQLVTQMTALAELEKKESLRILNNKYNEEKSATIKDSDGKIIGRKYTNNGLIELEKQFTFDVQTINEEHQQKLREINKKGEQIMLLDTLQMQIDNLKYLQKHLSTKSALYQEYSRQISIIQNQINQITNQPKSLEIKDKLQISEGELQRLIKFNEQISKAFEGKDYSKLSRKQRKEALKQIEEFEARQTQIQENAEIQRKINRTISIQEEQKNFDKDTDEWRALELERQNILIGLERDAIDKRLKKQKEALLSWKEFANDLNDIIGKILDRMIQITQKRIENEQTLLDTQKKSVETQEQRAQQGMANTLAFEQRQLAERESMLLKQQKKEERLQKIKALWTSYSSYADKEKNPDTAIIKALRDFAIIESITASFGDGGVVEDKLPSNGIFRGRSHNGKHGGIPILVEGQEGIFSKREMANLGKENFYKMKELAGLGQVDSNFFSGQRDQFVQMIAPGPLNNLSSLSEEMRNVKIAIEKKPVQNLDVLKLSENILEFVETVQSKNKTVRNHYQLRKKRF